MLRKSFGRFLARAPRPSGARRRVRLAILPLEDRVTPVAASFVPATSSVIEGVPPGPGGTVMLAVKLDAPAPPGGVQVGYAYNGVGTAALGTDFYAPSGYIPFTVPLP